MGSLTTPPCTEGAIWTVFTDLIDISSKQLQIVRGLNLNYNHRQPQLLNNRKVYSNFKRENSSNILPISLNIAQKIKEFIYKILNKIFN